jgi:hypothetical protein
VHKASHWSLSWVKWLQFTPSYSISWRSILILVSPSSNKSNNRIQEYGLMWLYVGLDQTTDDELHKQTNSLTLWRWVEKPPVAQLLEDFPAFYGNWRFITVFTRSI